MKKKQHFIFLINVLLFLLYAIPLGIELCTDYPPDDNNQYGHAGTVMLLVGVLMLQFLINLFALILYYLFPAINERTKNTKS